MRLRAIESTVYLILIIFAGFGSGCGWQSGTKGDSPFNSDYETPEVVNIDNFNNDSAKQVLLEAYLSGERDTSKYEHQQISEKLFFKDVKEDFRTHCNACHDGRGRAPFSFDSHKNIKRKAKTIREALITKVMPPWLAQQPPGTYCNEQCMPDHVRQRMISWIDQGTPLFDADSESEKTVSAMVRIDTTVLTIPAPVTHTLPTDSDMFVCTIYDPKLTEDTYVSGFEFNCTSADMVHHFTLFLDTMGLISDSDTTWVSDSGPVSEDEVVAIEGWTKGMRDIIYNPDFAYRIPKNAKFLLQTHYSGYGNKGRSEKTDLILHIAEKPKKEVRWWVLQNQKFNIKANSIVALSTSKTFDTTTTVLGVFPHLHFLGREVDVFGVYPDGKTVPMVNISNWDYLLQGKFMFKEPIVLPPGSSIVMNAIYDNTEDNPNQPNEPTRNMKWGRTGYNEMLVLMMYYTEGEPIESSCVARLTQ